MMDIVLGGGMGLVLALLLSNPPREKTKKPVTATVVEPVDAKVDKATNKSGANGRTVRGGGYTPIRCSRPLGVEVMTPWPSTSTRFTRLERSSTMTT